MGPLDPGGQPVSGTALVSTRKVLAIAGTGLRRTLRDPGALFFLFLFPMLLVLVLGSVFGGGASMRLGVAVPSDDTLGREVVAALEANDDIDVSRYDDEASLRDAVEHGEVQAGVVVPAGYTDRLTAGDDVQVGFVARPGGVGAQLRPVVEAAVEPQAIRVQAARFGSSHAGTDFAATLDEVTSLDASLPKVTVRTTTVGDELFPSSLGQFDLGASSQLSLFVFTNGLASATILISSRQLGVTRRMLSTPTPMRVVLFGEMAGRLAVTVFQGVYIIVTTWALFGVDWGNPVGALAVLVSFALVASGAAMLVGASFKNDQQATGISIMLALGLAALGGSMVPIEVFSPVMHDVAHVTPHAWANDAFAELVRHNGTVVDILPELGVLLAMAAVLTTLGVWRLRRALTASR
jgi:ABC-2 type transport system permease protein